MLNADFEIVEAEISGGRYVTEADYLRSLEPAPAEDDAGDNAEDLEQGD
jgi:hypothetical protein